MSPPSTHQPARLETAYQARRFTPRVEDKINQTFRVTRNETDTPLSSAELSERAKGADVLFVSAVDNVPADVIDALCPNLRAIATLSVGFDHIAIDAARAHGIAVFNTPGVLSDTCAEVALMLMLNAAHRGFEAESLVRSGTWQGWAPRQMLGYQLMGKTVGIFGMGRIGSAVAMRCRAFGMAIHYHNRNRLPTNQEQGAVYHATLNSLMPQSQFLVICAPSAPELNAAINAERLALLPKNAIVVNVARGALIDDDALIDALTNGHLFAAGLDVFNNEPNLDPRYRALHNVSLLSHIGSATFETRDAMGFLLLDGLAAYMRGEQAANQLI